MSGRTLILRVRITERATGRIITFADPDDEYYPFETEGGLISSVGYSEICALTDDEAVCGSGISSRSRDAVLTSEQLRRIYELSGGGSSVLGAFADMERGCSVPEEWLDEEVPDPADRDMLVRHPELYSFDFVLENYDQ